MKQEHAVTTTVAEFISNRLATVNKSDRELAIECGFDHPSLVTMLKAGTSKVPLNRIDSLARALDVNPAYLFRVVMREYMPDVLEAFESLTRSTPLSTNELDLIQSFRRVTGDRDAKAIMIDRAAVIAISVS